MNPIDKIIKNKLNHFTEEIPFGAWDQISKRLPNDAKKYGLMPSFLLATMSLCLLFSGLWAVSLHMTSNLSTIDKQLEINISSDQLIVSNNNDCITKENFSYLVSESSSNIKDQYNYEHLTVSHQNSEMIVREELNANLGVKQKEQDIVSLEGTTESPSTSFAVNMKRSNIDVATIKNINGKNKLKFYRPITFKTQFYKEGKSCPFNENLKDKSIDVYFSNDLNIKNMGLNDPLAGEYLSMRNGTESTMYSFSAGVRLGYNLGYRWNLHTGFNYSQANEKFQYIDPESNQTRIITIKDYIYLNGKIVDSVITEEKVVVPGTTILKVFNKTRSIDIPVLARFTILANKNLSLSALSGVYINLKTSYKGMIIGPDGNAPSEFSNIKINGEDAFKTQLGLSLFGGVSLAYHLTHDIDLLIEPHARIQTESMTINQFAINQKMNSFGLNLGLRHKF
jgi:hypothetical protein